MNHRGTETQRRQQGPTTDYTDNTDEGNSRFLIRVLSQCPSFDHPSVVGPSCFSLYSLCLCASVVHFFQLL